MLWLAVFDRFVPGLLRRAEKERYEGGGVFRFENSDLFALGPLVSYLREHPRSDRRRIVFFGNSIIFGYGLAAAEAIPARFQAEQPGTKVFNAAFNGAELESSYLIARAIVDQVDGVYVLIAPRGAANAMLPSLIPIEPSDLRDFALRPPDSIERRLESLAGIWRLYASRYRLQAAVLSTSTRQYVYLHKRDIVRRLLAPFSAPAAAPPATWPPNDGRVDLRAPRSAAEPPEGSGREFRQRHQLLCRFADLARSHGKRAVFVQVEGVNFELTEPEVSDFNAMFAPYAEVVILVVPPSLKYDTLHVTPQGAQAAAVALSRHESARAAGLP